ncbi:dihydroorotase [Bordetella avium]|nr:dihydroorotase [Bordetella avium]RIQ55477.1 dihydroorotase [Bordetella avium]RIQ73812.1 dihydroorotase [Bordetella avium]
MRVHIQGGFDPLREEMVDLFLADGQIVARHRAPDGFAADCVMDARGLALLPGLTDLSARLGADAARESQAALSGGVTRLVLPAGQPAADSPLHLAHVGPLTQTGLADMAGLMDAGCVGIGDDAALPDTGQLWRAMQYAAGLGATLWLRPEDAHLGGVAAAGPYATRLGLPGSPVEAEILALQTLFTLQRATGTRLHLCRLSSAAGVALLRAARAEGLPVTADISIHHLHLTDLDIGFYDSNCHLRPPLRGQRDRDALAQALADGTLDALCSDHHPVSAADKALPFAQTPPGASGVELLLPLTLKWARAQGLPLSRALACLTTGPARVLGLPAPSLMPGEPADLCLVDTECEWLLSAGAMRSGSAQTPFAGMMLPGRVRATLIGGRALWEMPA